MTTTVAMPGAGFSLLELAMQILQAADTSSRECDEECFHRIISEYGHIVNRICYTFARSGDDFDDLRQDALLSIWRALPGFRGECATGTWIYRVTINRCVSFFRKPGAKTDYVSLSSLLNISSESGCDDSDNIVRLHEQIARLPEQDKALLLLWLDGLSYNDIAELMGFPRNTIASRLHRVKEKLKSRLCN